MLVTPVEIPVCKPCPKCGAVQVKMWGNPEKSRIRCSCQGFYISNHEARPVNDVIHAWNTLVSGQEKTPEQKTIPYQVVQYEKKVHPIRKIGKASVIPWYTFAAWDVHERNQALHEEKRRMYHKIADELFEECIGETSVYTSDFEKDIILRTVVQVVDDR